MQLVGMGRFALTKKDMSRTAASVNVYTKVQ